MKNYSAFPMLKRSLNYNHFVKLQAEQRNEVVDRMNRLIQQEKELCDRGNYQHLSDILSTIAIYQMLCEGGFTEDKALEAVSVEIYRALEPRRRAMERFATYSWFWGFMKRILPFAFRLGSGAGWRFTWFRGQPRDEYRFEVNECIYQKIFARHGIKALGPMICHCDIILYGTLPYIDFQRKGTLCYDEKVCDFKFIRHPKSKPFERFDSR